MEPDDRRLITAALEALHSALTALRHHVQQTTTSEMWPDTERRTFGPIENALATAENAIQELKSPPP